jgi:hypothetical protein
MSIASQGTPESLSVKPKRAGLAGRLVLSLMIGLPFALALLVVVGGHGPTRWLYAAWAALVSLRGLLLMLPSWRQASVSRPVLVVDGAGIGAPQAQERWEFVKDARLDRSGRKLLLDLGTLCTTVTREIPLRGLDVDPQVFLACVQGYRSRWQPAARD